MFSSGDFGVGGGDCKSNDGKSTVEFQPAFPASCASISILNRFYSHSSTIVIFDRPLCYDRWRHHKVGPRSCCRLLWRRILALCAHFYAHFRLSLLTLGQFAAPSYQSNVTAAFIKTLGSTYSGKYNATGRGYPDVAAQASGFQVVIGGSTESVGGTSASSPVSYFATCQV